MNFFKDKRILITGHTGFKGIWLSEILSLYGANILGYSLENNIEYNFYESLNLNNKIKSVIGDIRNFEKLKKEILDFKPEIIFHLAAEAIVQNANDNPLNSYQTNALGVANLLESVRYCDSVKSIIIVSTDAVYEAKENKCVYTEEDKICGQNTYSNSKSCAELIVENYKKLYFKDFDYPRISITRCVNIIGGGDFNSSRIIPYCINSWINNEKIKLRQPKNSKCFLHVFEALHGYLSLAKSQYLNKEKEGIYNFSPDEGSYISIEEMVSLIYDKLEMSNKFKGVGSSNIIYKISNKKAKEQLNWKPTFDFYGRIDKTINWYKKNIDGENIADLTDVQIKEFFANKLI